MAKVKRIENTSMPYVAIGYSDIAVPVDIQYNTTSTINLSRAVKTSLEEGVKPELVATNGFKRLTLKAIGEGSVSLEWYDSEEGNVMYKEEVQLKDGFGLIETSVKAQFVNVVTQGAVEDASLFLVAL